MQFYFSKKCSIWSHLVHTCIDQTWCPPLYWTSRWLCWNSFLCMECQPLPSSSELALLYPCPKATHDTVRTRNSRIVQRLIFLILTFLRIASFYVETFHVETFETFIICLYTYTILCKIIIWHGYMMYLFKCLMGQVKTILLRLLLTYPKGFYLCRSFRHLLKTASSVLTISW